jgi:hypothetical protein
MSRKLMLVCLLAAWGGVALAQSADGDASKGGEPVHAKRPLDNAKGRVQANEAAQPQSQGLDNANARVTENQARWIEKHQTPDVARVERVERVDRPGRPDLVRITTSDIVRSNGAAAPRPDRPGLGKGR